MSTRAELAPLFTDLALSADDATAIVAALHDVAESDGKHEQEVDMIRGFIELLDADLGAETPTKLPAMTPAKLAATITSPDVRTAAVQCAVLLAWADGVFSDQERARILDYATALGFSRPDYDRLETTVSDWVKSGDVGPLF